MARNNAGSVAAPARPKSNRIAVLPDHAAHRMAVLEQESTLAADISSGLSASVQHTFELVEDARTDLGRAEERVREGHGNPAEVEAAKVRVAKARARHEAAIQRSQDAISRKATVGDLYGDAKRWLATTNVATLVDARPKEVGTIAAERDAVARLMRERDAVAQAPVSLDEALSAIRRQVEQAARDGAPSVAGAAEPARRNARGEFEPAPVKVILPTRRLHGLEPSKFSGDSAAPVIVDVEKLVMSLFGDRLLPVLEEDVREAYRVEGTEGIDQHTRHRRLRELKLEIFAAQRRAAEAAWQALGRGESVEWWAPIPPSALLGVRIDEELQRRIDEAAGAGRAAA